MEPTPAMNGLQAEALDRLTRLQALTASLSEAVTSEQVAEVILAQAAVVLGTSTGVVARLSDDGGEFVYLHATGYSKEVVKALSRFPADARMPLADAVRDRRPVLLANLAERDASYPDLARLTGVRAEGALAALPLVVRGKAIGGIGLRFPAERTFTEQDRAFLLTVAGLCAQALERARLFDTERAARERAERAEDALRESEGRFVRFMQHLPGLAWVKDGQGRYVYANDAAMNAFGKPRVDIYGRTDVEVFPPATAAQFRENDLKALASGIGVRVVETLQHADGTLHHSLVSKFPIPGPDEGAAFVGGMAIDITEEMRTRAVLEESEERLRATFEQAAVGIAHVGPDGRWLRVNQKLCDIVGYHSDELLALTFQDITHPEDLEADLAHVRRLLAGEIATYSMDKRYFRKDRSLVWVNLTVSLVRTAEAQPKYFISVVEDITEKKQVREALRESEERLRTLSNNLPQGAVYQGVIDRQGRRQCTYISAGVERLFGVTPAEVMADATLLYRLVHEEDQVRLASQEEAALGTLTPLDCEFRSWTRSGTLLWVHTRSASRRLANGETVWEGIVLDVTARKRAEEELACLTTVSEKRRRLYEAALSNTPDLVYVFDLDHRFTYANEGLLRMWGKTWDEAIGKNCLELGYEALHAAMHDREIEQVKATRQPVKGEVPFTGTFGRRIYEYIFVPVLGDNGEVEAVAGTTRDVTDRKTLEGRLRDQAEQLREADRKKDEFLATLAHELRNPLAPIRNGLQIMKLAAGHAEAVEQARAMMERQLVQMGRLLDDLLDVSRITRGKLELRREWVELASVVQSAVEGSRPLIEASGHRLTVALPPEPVLLNADPMRLAQVFANLLTNAAKYTDKGGRIWLTAELRGQGSGDRGQGRKAPDHEPSSLTPDPCPLTPEWEVVVTVKDTGIGIAPEHLPRLFEMFSQVTSALERSQGGLGIGLSLVRGLTEMHGGSVEARSEGSLKGSEFIVRLPVVDGLTATQTQHAASGERTATRPRSRILVADDNRDAADSLAMMLRLGGHEVHAVHDGQEAIDAADWFRPDLALLDIGMPKLNGYEASRRIRAPPWGKKIVLAAVTGWGQEEDKQRATEAGFDHHLTKPVDPAALEKVLAGLRRP